MVGFPCSAFLALSLMAIIFLQGAATSIDSPATQVSAMPSSNISHAGTAAPRITFPPPSFPPDDRQQDAERLNSCPNCKSYKDDNSEDSPVHKLRIEMIKAKILEKLQMDRPPVLKHKRRDGRITALLANLSLIQQKNDKDQSKDSNEENLETTTKIIVFSERAKSRSKRRVSRKEALFEFKLSRNTLGGSVSSAQMWLNKRKTNNMELKGKTFQVRVRMPGIGDKTGTVKAKVKARKSGWVVLDIEDIIQKWFGPNREPQQSSNATGAVLEIQLSCKNCEAELSHLISTRGKNRPFLFISTKSEAATSRRKRRPSDCISAKPVHCCRQMLYVNFSKIGWNWVIYPEGFNANYCEGPCESRISPLNGYAFLLQEMERRRLTTFSLCCSPSKLSGLSMLYFAQDESIMKQNLSDMRVEECGCT